jgi:hypothetical protein
MMDRYVRTTLAFLAFGAGLFTATACSPTVSTSTGVSELQPALAGSSAVPKPSPTILRQPDLGPKPHGWLSAKHQGSLIYVADGNQVLIYPESGFNPRQIGAITDGVSGSWGLFVDASRDLYVANSNTITGYHPGHLSPFIVYSDPDEPLYVTKNHSGTLYAANHDGTVTEYLQGQTKPSLTLQTPGVEADGINIDNADNVYVAYRDHTGNGSIKKFKANSRNGSILGMQITQPQGLQLDRSKRILVVETGSKHDVEIFAPGKTTPSKVVQAAYGVEQVVLRNANENMYVSNFINDYVYISHYPPGQFQPKIETGVSGVEGMALSNAAP